jgi:hypothetical protein
MTKEKIAALIIRAIRTYEAPLFLNEYWEYALCTEPSTHFAKNLELDTIHNVYRVSYDDDFNREVLMIILNSFQININQDWLKGQSGEYLICRYPNSKLSNMHPHILKTLEE